MGPEIRHADPATTSAAEIGLCIATAHGDLARCTATQGGCFACTLAKRHQAQFQGSGEFFCQTFPAMLIWLRCDLYVRTEKRTACVTRVSVEANRLVT